MHARRLPGLSAAAQHGYLRHRQTCTRSGCVRVDAFLCGQMPSSTEAQRTDAGRHAGPVTADMHPGGTRPNARP